MPTLTIQGKTYEICQFSGEILEANKQRETQVHGSGGGGATYKGTGGTAPVNVYSTTTIHNEFFVLDRSGQEHSVSLANWNLNLRNGHDIQLIWLIPPKQAQGPYVLLNNHSLKKYYLKTDIVQAIAKNHYRAYFWFAILAAIVSSMLFKSLLLLIIMIIAIWVIYKKKKKKIYNDLTSALEKEMD